jgi:lambda family phage minor tail protein L
MDNLLNVDLQEQSPSAEETVSGNAIVTLFEIYLADSDLGGSGTDKLYFHDGTKSPADSYGSLQMYSPTAESSWGSTTASDYSLVTYTPFPFEFSGYERRTKGALPRPTIRFANINRDFTVYNTNHDDLLGAKVIRRRTLAKYLLENPPVEFPKEIYYVERLVSENQLMVEFELTTNFDVRGVLLPSRRIVAARCPWKYKDSTVGGCDWPTDSTKDITDNNSSTTSQKIYVDVDDNYITSGTSSTSKYNVWSPSTALLNEALDNSETTIDYDTATSSDIPTAGTIIIDSEEITYTGKSSTQFTGCTRGANSTTAAVHSNNATISIIYKKDAFAEYYIPLAADYTVSAAVRVDATHVIYTTAGTSLGFSVNDYINVRGSAVSDWDFSEIHLKISAVAEPDNTTITVITAESSGFDDYTSGGLISKTRNTLFKCKRNHTPTAPRRPGVATTDWEVGDICGKRLISCRMRYGYNPNAGSVEAITVKQGSGGAVGGSGYNSAPALTFTGGGGSGASATATISGGAVTGVTSLVGGSGYSTPPTVVVNNSGTGGSGAQLIATCRGALGEPDDVPLPFGGFPGAVTYS